MNLEHELLARDPDRIWFTSDTHFGHANVLHLCNRPFRTIVDHDETLIRNWNELVEPDDIVFHLGDFCWTNAGYVKSLLSRLYGNVVFLRGNHEAPLEQYFDGLGPNQTFPCILDYYQTPKPVRKHWGTPLVTLLHYPMVSWNGSHHGSWQFFGHTHGNWKNALPNQLEVGVDLFDYRPVSLSMLKTIMLARTAGS